MAIETSNKVGLLSLAYPQIFAGDDRYFVDPQNW
jgi:hypothetical protein